MDYLHKIIIHLFKIILFKPAALPGETLLEAHIEKAEKDGTSSSLLHRLKFTDDKIASAVKGLRELSQLPDPVGKVREMRELDPGFVLKKVAFPIGVIAMIFEARPDALVQIAGLALRSANAVVLKGGREAENSNRTLISIIREATEDIVKADWILGIESHADVDTLLTLEKDIDLVIIINAAYDCMAAGDKNAEIWILKRGLYLGSIEMSSDMIDSDEWNSKSRCIAFCKAHTDK